MKIAVLIILILTSISQAIILHPENEPGVPVADRPADNAVAHIGCCSGVPISPHYLITARHFTVTTSTPIRIDGLIYYPAEIWDHPNEDIKLIRVEEVLENFTSIPDPGQGVYDYNNLDNVFVIGGFGFQRGANEYADYDPNLVVGYAWGSNRSLKWGTNKAYYNNHSYLYTYFDAPGDTPYEAALSMYDSGSPVFYYYDNQWWVIGLGVSVSDMDGSWFLNPYNYGYPYQTSNSYVRTSVNSGWIKSIMYGADMNEDGIVDVEDLSLFSKWWLADENLNTWVEHFYFYYFARSDLNRDGYVNLKDFSIFSRDWLK